MVQCRFGSLIMTVRCAGDIEIYQENTACFSVTPPFGYFIRSKKESGGAGIFSFAHLPWTLMAQILLSLFSNLKTGTVQATKIQHWHKVMSELRVRWIKVFRRAAVIR